MTKKLSLIIVGIVLLLQGAIAQDYSFRVLASKGQNMVKGGGSDWQPLKTGAKLNSGEEVKLAANGYLGLVHSSGKTIELKEPSVYNVTKLSNELGSSSQNIAAKYADFVMSKMSPQQVEENRKKYASVTGAAERGAENASINLFMPQSVSVLNKKAIIRWEPVRDNAVYVVNLKNLFEEKILVAETTDPFYTIDFTNEKIKDAIVEHLIIVNVSLKDDESIASKNAAIELMSDEDAKTYEVQLEGLESNIGGESSINNLILAEFYEENGLLLDAVTSYEDAVKLSPDVEYFQEAYNEFLIRNSLMKPKE
jgi:predicted  nucleic acid-binding Zn-ribbon protein